MKTCRVCKEQKPEAEFSVRSVAKAKKATTCKRCIRNFHSLRRYGLSQDQYEVEYERLEGHCPICRRWYERLAIDHNHETREYRGLLCLSCNRTIAYLEDRGWMKRAKRYLKGELQHAL